MMRASPLPEDLLALLPRRSDEGPRVWLVGGAVRDWLLERPILDLDFAVEGDALALARSVADGLQADYYPLDPSRNTGRVLVQDSDTGKRIYDFAGLRGPDILTDLRDRDFTINAMAVDPFDLGRLIDPTGGLRDLKEKRLRACSDSAFLSDPLRVLRAVRLSQMLELRMEAETITSLKAATHLIESVSPERVRDELMRIFGLAEPSGALRLMLHLNLWEAVFPELPARTDGAAVETALRTLGHAAEILAVLDPVHDEERAADAILGSLVWRLGRYRQAIYENLNAEVAPDRARRPLLFLAGLFHLVGCSSIGPNGPAMPCPAEARMKLAAQRLRLSRRESRFLLRVLSAMHELRRIEDISPLVVYRYFNQAPDAGVGTVLLDLASQLAKQPGPPSGEDWEAALAKSRTLLEAAFERREELIDPPSLVDGTKLISSLGLRPGPEIGRLLERIREAQVEGLIQTEEQALEWTRRWIQAGR
ncbi:MAG TPA: CCA tRNA nucleotidyltransferase [Chloroflexi bacterium]|nr:CCA tRNA nucleotidyltransferase [Chloroflexota bacterium]